MGKTEYHKQQEDELQNHFCAYRDMYAYKSTKADKMQRQLEAADAGKYKMARTICPFFLHGEANEFPLPNGRCSAADNEVCQVKCRKRHWEIVDGKLVKV